MLWNAQISARGLQHPDGNVNTTTMLTTYITDTNHSFKNRFNQILKNEGL